MDGELRKRKMTQKNEKKMNSQKGEIKDEKNGGVGKWEVEKKSIWKKKSKVGIKEGERRKGKSEERGKKKKRG